MIYFRKNSNRKAMYLTQLISPKFKIDRYAIVVLFLLCANEVAERQCFTPVCQSFCSQGEVYTPLGRHPPADTPWQTSPLPDTHLGRHPPGRHPPGRPPPGSDCCGRYASYWNAFSSTLIFEIQFLNNFIIIILH